MARTASAEGTCSHCGLRIPGTVAAMEKHFRSCDATQKMCPAGEEEASAPQSCYYRILVRARHARGYWLMLDMKADATLRQLDKFLRDTWLECCGHLSGFTIDGIQYESDLQDQEDWRRDGSPAPRSMKVPVQDVLNPGGKAAYLYDYGSTTELTLHVVSERTGKSRRKAVLLLGRNEPPTLVCGTCGSHSAIAVCAECAWEGGGFLCGDCLKTHSCDADMLMPVVNSPRMGVCDYRGTMEDNITFELFLSETDASPKTTVCGHVISRVPPHVPGGGSGVSSTSQPAFSLDGGRGF